MMEIGGWLRSLGLEQYEAAFHANAVDADVLCVIRRKAATDSDAIRPRIPTEVGHPFRSKPATLVRPV